MKSMSFHNFLGNYAAGHPRLLWRDDMNIMRALLIVGAGLVATATAHAASAGLSINEDHKASRCKSANLCRSAINPLAQY